MPDTLDTAKCSVPPSPTLTSRPAARCPPCRAFTPHLAAVYSALKARGVDVEVIFVSHDRDAASFEGYLRGQAGAGGAWAALPFAAAAEREQLARTFKVAGIPSLAVVGPGGEVLASNAVGAVRGDATGAGFPWEGASGPSAPPVWVLILIVLALIYLPKVLGALWG